MALRWTKRKLAVAFNSYDLAGGGKRWKRLRELVDRPESKLVEYDFQTRQAVIDYIRKRGTITPTVGELVDVRSAPPAPDIIRRQVRDGGKPGFPSYWVTSLTALASSGTMIGFPSERATAPVTVRACPGL